VRRLVSKINPVDGDYPGELVGWNLKFTALSAEDGKSYNFIFVQACKNSNQKVTVSVINSIPTFKKV
jgi:hypothetical protein